MANQVAIALENARLFQETQQALNEIRANQQAQISKAWSETLDARGDGPFLSAKSRLLMPKNSKCLWFARASYR